MLYRPHFCCHCGEKIVRAKWTPLTSRRFCDFCAVEQKQHDLLPRAAAVVMLIFGAAGISSYLGGGKHADPAPRAAISPRTELQVAPSKSNSTSIATNRNAAAASNVENSAANTKQREPIRESSTEAVYYCGALTKKGTACTRRVKSLGRCWQHLGQPSATDARK